MRRLLRIMAIYSACICVVSHSAEKPNIVILATGGSIAGQGKSSVGSEYTAAKVPVEDLLKSVPEINTLAAVTGEQVCQVSSQDMNSNLLLKLAKKVIQILNKKNTAGIVITHGTDTMEETAYFLHLVVKSNKPVIITGAMRAPSSLSADGALNLYNAVALAASPEAKGKGVLLLFNDRIHCAREVTKRNTINTSAFETPEYGILGYVQYGKIAFYRESTRKHTGKSEFDISTVNQLPTVAILYGYAGFDYRMVEQAIAAKVQGIVYAGMGNGNPDKKTEQALAEAVKKGIVIVRSSRTGSGAVTLHAEVDDKKHGFVVADNLNPNKSRVLLMLALTRTTIPEVIQKMFLVY